jgi:hypothetical protein
MYWPKYKRALFPGQQDGEEIHMEIRQHWMMLLIKLVAWGLFAAILILSSWAIDNYAPVLKTAPYASYVDLIRSVYLMFLILGLLIVWVMYYLNVQIITNRRVVDITQNSLVHHTISELHLRQIEDVTAEVEGLFGTLLDYGNVYVQTAGTTDRFVFDHVPNPTAVEKMILDLYEALPEDQKQKNFLGK